MKGMDVTHITGPLHYESVGRSNRDRMVLLHPNPMDSTSWLYQTAHFATWFNCIAIDLPGYGRSPAATSGLTMEEIAEACWTAVDAASESDTRAVLVGCSVGAELVQYMYHARPDAVGALVLSGTGWSAEKSFCTERIEEYRRNGIGFRHEHTLRGFSPAFADSDLGRWFAEMFTERNRWADLASIEHIYTAMLAPLLRQDEIDVPVLIASGELDVEHANAFVLRDRLPNARLVTIEGAGHACQVEQPHVFNRVVREFLEEHRLLPAG